MSKGYNFTPKHWLPGVASTVVASLILGYITEASWRSLVASTALAVVGAYLTFFLLYRHDAKLTSRMQDGSGLIWDVVVNGVKVGSMTDAEYAAIQRQAFSDGRLVLAQGLNVCHVAMIFAGKIFWALPPLVFWLFVVAAVISPGSVIEGYQSLLSADTEALKGALSILPQLAVLFAILMSVIMVIRGYHFGFRNCFRETVARKIRLHCKVAAEGEILLARGYGMVPELP